MAKSTPATLALEKAGVAFKLHEYDYDPNAARIGMQRQAVGHVVNDAELLDRGKGGDLHVFEMTGK